MTDAGIYPPMNSARNAAQPKKIFAFGLVAGLPAAGFFVRISPTIRGSISAALHKTTGGIAAVCDRDAVIAVAGGGKRELLDRRISRELEELMSTRGQYAADSCTLPVVDTDERYAVAVAAPILSEGDVLGCVLFVAAHGDGPAGETERKLAQAVSGFLGKQMES